MPQWWKVTIEPITDDVAEILSTDRFTPETAREEQAARSFAVFAERYEQAQGASGSTSRAPLTFYVPSR